MQDEYLTIRYPEGTEEICKSKGVAIFAANALVKARKEFQIVPSESGRTRTILFAGFCGVVIQALDSLHKTQEKKHYGNPLCDACEAYMKTVYTLIGKDSQLIYIEEEIISSFKQIDISDCINTILYISKNEGFAENWLTAPYLFVANKARMFLTNALKEKPNEKIGKEIYQIVFANSTVKTEELYN